MSSVLILFTKLIGLVLLKIVSNAVFVAIAFFRRTGKELSRSLLTICHFKDAQNKPLKSDCIFGIVVITRFCTQGSGLQHEGSHIVSGPLKNSAFFERVIGEVSVDTVVSWAAKIIHKNSLRISAQNIAFILVHGKDCSSFFNLKKWFHIIPNHQQGKRHLENVQVEAKKDDAVPLTDEYHIRSFQLYTRIIPISRQLTTVDYDSSVKSKLLSKFQYVTSEKEDCSKLLEVGLQTAIKKNLNYIIVINPRAIDLREHLLTETIQLLTGENRNCQVDVVLGITKRCSRISQSKNMQISNSQTESFNGLYLLGLKCSRSLMPKISLLCNNVEWSSISTADRLWRNIYQSFPNWNSVCLRERLEEVFEPLDLLNLQQSTGLLYEHVLNDSISVIIPMGYGHPDDCLDPEDVELTNSKSSNSLVNTIDLAVHNASGKRQIEIIIINSSPVQNNDSRNLTTAGLLITEPFRNIRLRSMVSIHLYYYNPIETNRFYAFFVEPDKGGEAALLSATFVNFRLPMKVST
ncbi:unnamed protein product [Heterobilharzia americana]|nr:unnamed protein product [Heterobilharzia americana]